MPNIGKWTRTLNKAQQKSLAMVFCRTHLPYYDKKSWRSEYRNFRRSVRFSFGVAMVPWQGMWLGIEDDGYTHS